MGKDTFINDQTGLHLKLFSEVLFVNGHIKSVLVDVGRYTYYNVPNEIIKLQSINQKLDQNLDDTEREYVKFLIDNELAYWADKFDFENIPEIDYNWYSPHEITNVDLEVFNLETLIHSINLIKDLEIPNLVLTCLEGFIISNLETLLKAVDDSTIINVFIIINKPDYINSELLNFLSNDPRVNSIYLNGYTHTISDATNKIIISNDFEVKTSGINEVDFNANLKFFTESQSHNTYFNRKLYIGPLGEIKNAPECEDIHGYIHSPEELKEIISAPKFQKYWFVHKELIDVCKDCEFRHMCLDNRVPIERSESEWFHTLECNYNPYICKWAGEEGYQNLSSIGVVSNENGFSIDHKKIGEINANLWEEE